MLRSYGTNNPLPGQQSADICIEISQHNEIVSLDDEIQQCITRLKKARLKHKIRYIPIAFASFIILGSTAGCAYAIYRWLTHSVVKMNELDSGAQNNTNTDYLQQYNECTGYYAYSRYVPDLVKSYDLTLPYEMDRKCGDMFTLGDVCTNLFDRMGNARKCFDKAMDLCEKNGSLADYNNYLRCGSRYPLNNICDVETMMDYLGGLLHYACAWAAFELCQKSLATLDDGVMKAFLIIGAVGVSMAILLFGMAGCGVGLLIGHMAKCFDPKREISDLSYQERNQAHVVAAKVGIEIADNDPIDSVLDTLRTKKNYITACQKAFLAGSNILNKHHATNYGLFHGYKTADGKIIKGDGDHQCVKKIFEHAGLPVIKNIKSFRRTSFFPVQQKECGQPERGSVNERTLLLQVP